MEKKTFVFNIEWRDALKDCSAEIRHEVYDAIVEYAAVGVVPPLSSLAQMAFQFIKREMDNNTRKYEEIVQARREAGKRGLEKRWGNRNEDMTSDSKNSKCHFANSKNSYNDNDNDNDNDIKKETKKEKTSTALVVFHPPTLDEVQAYIATKGYNIDAEAFIAYYDSNGWMVGKNKMKNWRAALVTWQKKEYSPVNNNNHYDRRQQAKQATIARQNAAIDRIIEEESLLWEQQQQQLSNGGSIEGV